MAYRQSDIEEPYHDIRKLNPQLTMDDIQPYVDMKWNRQGATLSWPKKPTQKREMQEYLMSEWKPKEVRPMEEGEPVRKERGASLITLGKKERAGLIGMTLVFVFVGGFAGTDIILENVSPGAENNLLIAAGVGVGAVAILGGLSYAAGILKI